jgi:hypothetical protein
MGLQLHCKSKQLLEHYGAARLDFNCTITMAFTSPDAVRRSVVRRQLAARWNMPMELATDLASLALYDIVIYADDSGSMIFEEGGERINDLKLILGRVAEVTLVLRLHADSACGSTTFRSIPEQTASIRLSGHPLQLHWPDAGTYSMAEGSYSM